MDDDPLSLQLLEDPLETVRRKDGSPRYRESYYFGNKKINGPYFTKITEAKAWKRRMETEKLTRLAYGDLYIENKDAFFGEYADSWLENEIKSDCVPKTYLNYESILRVHLKPRFGSLKLSEIKEHHGRKLLEDLKKTKTPKGIAYVWGVIRSVLIKARKERIILHYPFENIQLPREVLKDENFWSKAEVNHFLSRNMNDSLFPLFFVAIHSGLRMAELCGLKWDRIDFSQNHISVTRTRDKFGLKETTKTKLKRIVPMTPDVRAILLNLFAKRNESNFVFLESNGNPVDYGHIYRRFKQAQTKAEIAHKIRFHDLRHTFASNYMMSGGNQFDLQKLLGHTDFKMTMRYAHLAPDHFQNSLKFMNIASSESIPVLDLSDFEKQSNVRAMQSKPLECKVNI